MSLPNYRTIIAFTGNEHNLCLLYSDLMKSEQMIKEGKAGWIGKLLRLHNSDQANHVPYNYTLMDIWLDRNNHLTCLKILLFDGHAPMLSVFDTYAELYEVEYVYLAEDYTNGVFVNSDKEGAIFNWRCFFTLEPCKFVTTAGFSDPALENKLTKLCHSPFHTSYESFFNELKSDNVSVNSIDEMQCFLDMLKKRYSEETFHFRAYAEKI